MIRHIVMWDVRGDTPTDKLNNMHRIQACFLSLKGQIPGLLSMDIGVDTSRIDCACDVVMFSEFESQAALDAYATHPAHLRVKEALGNLRTARHQVDYTVAARAETVL